MHFVCIVVYLAAVLPIILLCLVSAVLVQAAISLATDIDTYELMTAMGWIGLSVGTISSVWICSTKAIYYPFAAHFLIGWLITSVLFVFAKRL